MKRVIIIKIVFVIFACLAIFGFASCKKNSDNSDSSSSQPIEDNIKKFEFIVDKVYLDIYSSEALQLNADDGLEIIWASSAPTIVSVDSNGVVYSYGEEGQATITATAGNKSIKCTVTVSDCEYALILKLSEKEVTLKKGGTFNISAEVFFRNENVTDKATISWYNESEYIASLSTLGVLTANNIGQTAITAYAFIYGKQTSATITVQVVETGAFFYFDEGFSFDIYALDEEGNNTIFNPSVFVYDDNGEVLGADINYFCDDDIVSIAGDNTITIQSAGEAEIVLTYVDSHGKTITSSIYLTIHRREVPLDKVINIETARAISAILDFEPKGDVESIVWDGISVEAEYDNTSHTIILSDDKQKLISSAEKLNTPIKIYTSGAIYEMRANVYGAIIKTKEDLKLVGFNDKWQRDEKYNINGYFVINNDINCSGMTFNVTNSGYNEKLGFMGTLDGQGHTLSNISVGSWGIFGATGVGATIKNLNFTEVAINGSESALFASHLLKTTISNVNIQIKSMNSQALAGATGIFACRTVNGSTFDNVYVDASTISVPCVFGNDGFNVNRVNNMVIKAYSLTALYYNSNNVAITENQNITVNITSKA